MHVAIVGTGFSGLVTGAMLAEVGHSVTFVVSDRAQVARMRSGAFPVQEPGLEESVRRSIQELRLEVTTNLGDGVRGAAVVLLALESPLGADGGTDIAEWATTAGRLATLIRPYTVVGVCGTVRIGSTQLLRTILAEDGRRAGRDYDVVTLPALLHRGSAMAEARAPRRLVVGSGCERATSVVRDLYAPFLRDGAQLVVMNERSAEATRFAAAALRVVLRGLTAELADFCAEAGADLLDVLAGSADDSVVARRLARSHTGFPAAEELRDARALVDLSAGWGCSAWTIDAALDQVPRSADAMVTRVRDAVGGDLAGLRIGIWGMASAPGTDDVSDALGIRVARAIREAGATVAVHSPGAEEAIRRALGDLVDVVDAPHAALIGADALLVLSNIPAVRSTDFTRVRRLMARPVLIDPLALWEARQMREAGMTYHGGAGATGPVAAQSACGTSSAWGR
jgi:UDPglucose 6-dehydrogenase